MTEEKSEIDGNGGNPRRIAAPAGLRSRPFGKAATGVRACVHAPMTSYQWAAYTSLAFNIGTGAFCRSSIARRANAGDTAGACAAISLYVYAGGKRVQGLANRRAGERALCEGRT